MRNLSIRRKAFPLMLLLVLVVGIYHSCKAFFADLYENTVISALDSWQENGSVPSLEEWNVTFSHVSKLTYGKDLAEQISSDEFRTSLLDRPVNNSVGNYYRLLALTYEWRMFVDDAPSDIPEELSFIKLAIHAWSASTKVRPAWPEDWSQLARNKAYLGEYDETFYRALTQAIKLGKHEAATQLIIIQTASMSWSFLSQSYDGIDVKAEVLALITAALTSNHNLPQHLSMLSDYGLLGEVCANIDTVLLVSQAQQACADT